MKPHILSRLFLIYLFLNLVGDFSLFEAKSFTQAQQILLMVGALSTGALAVYVFSPRLRDELGMWRGASPWLFAGSMVSHLAFGLVEPSSTKTGFSHVITYALITGIIVLTAASLYKRRNAS